MHTPHHSFWSKVSWYGIFLVGGKKRGVDNEQRVVVKEMTNVDSIISVDSKKRKLSLPGDRDNEWMDRVTGSASRGGGGEGNKIHFHPILLLLTFLLQHGHRPDGWFLRWKPDSASFLLITFFSKKYVDRGKQMMRIRSKWQKGRTILGDICPLRREQDGGKNGGLSKCGICLGEICAYNSQASTQKFVIVWDTLHLWILPAACLLGPQFCQGGEHKKKKLGFRLAPPSPPPQQQQRGIHQVGPTRWISLPKLVGPTCFKFQTILKQRRYLTPSWSRLLILISEQRPRHNCCSSRYLCIIRTEERINNWGEQNLISAKLSLSRRKPHQT